MPVHSIFLHSGPHSWNGQDVVGTGALKTRYADLVKRATASQGWAQGLIAEATRLEQWCYFQASLVFLPPHLFMTWLGEQQQLCYYYKLAGTHRQRAGELHQQAHNLLSEAKTLLQDSEPSFLRPHPEVDPSVKYQAEELMRIRLENTLDIV